MDLLEDHSAHGGGPVTGPPLSAGNWAVSRKLTWCAAALVVVPWRLVSRPRAVRLSSAGTMADLAIWQAFARSRLLTVTTRAGLRRARFASSNATRSSASLSVGASPARVSMGWPAASDNVYYVNYRSGPKKSPAPADRDRAKGKNFQPVQAISAARSPGFHRPRRPRWNAKGPER